MKSTKQVLLKRRHIRVRRKVHGTAERPRLCIHKSLKHIYAQVINDLEGRTLAAVTTNTKSNKENGKSFCNIEWAKRLGGVVAQKAVAVGVQTVVFDRGGYRYHGVIKAFADAAREAGLKF